MGIKVMPEVTDYWSSNAQLGCAWISSVMTRARFFAITQYLQFTDCTRLIQRGRAGYNPVDKIRPIANYLKRRFADFYKPTRCMCVDEAMIAYKGRSSLKQYMPSKPTKWGIKVWELCDSENGYCVDFDVYAAKHYKPTRNGLGYDVVTKLVHDHLGKNHRIYFDRYFTSVHLVEYLLRNNTYACGTININRKGLPKEAKTVKLKRGESKVHEKAETGVTLTTWRDKRQIAVLSSCPTHGTDENGEQNWINCLDYLHLNSYIHLNTLTHTYILLNNFAHTHIYLSTTTHFYTRLHNFYNLTYLHTPIHFYIHLHIFTCTYTYLHLPTLLHAPTHTYRHPRSAAHLHIFTYAYTCLHTPAHTYTLLHTPTHFYTPTHTYIHLLTATHMHTFTYTHTFTCAYNAYAHLQTITYTYTYLRTYTYTYTLLTYTQPTPNLYTTYKQPTHNLYTT